MYSHVEVQMRGLSHPLFFVFYSEPHACPPQVAQGQGREPGQPDPESFPPEHHCPIQGQDWKGGHWPPSQKSQYQECECSLYLWYLAMCSSSVVNPRRVGGYRGEPWGSSHSRGVVQRGSVTQICLFVCRSKFFKCDDRLFLHVNDHIRSNTQVIHVQASGSKLTLCPWLNLSK